MEELKYIEFENYLNLKLTASELKSFEEKLKTDANFKQEFEIYKALESSLTSKFENEEAEKELRKTLADLGSHYINPVVKPKKETKIISLFNYKKLMVAASIALIIGFFIFNNGKPVYADFSNHSNLELVVRGDNNDAILTAEKAFNSKNYNDALQQLTLLSDSLNDVEIELYKGICQLELSNYVEADAIFDNISKGNSAFTNKARWYKALSFLKQERYEDCKRVLETIPESAEEYKQAKKLLKKL